MNIGNVAKVEQVQVQPAIEHQAGIRWQEVLLNPDVESEAYRRINGVLNILKNGAQTLTVLAMVDDPNSFVTPSNINRTVDKKAGGKVVKRDTTVKSYLAKCIEPMGAAAKSTLDDEMWALTPFGIEMKAALIFAWSKFLKAGINPMDVLGTTSRSKKGDDGHIINTPAVARATILTALDIYRVLNREKLVEILKLCGSAVSGHLTNLKRAGLVEFESMDTGSGKPGSHFILTDTGREQEYNWPVYTDSRGKNFALQTELTRKALEKLSVMGQDINTVSICAIILDKNPDFNRKGLLNSISHVLSFWVREGLLKRGKFNTGYLSEASLTDKGRMIVDEILIDLAMWSIDPDLAPKIESIAKRIRINPDAYQSIYTNIAKSFKETSLYARHNKKETLEEVLKAIRQNQGKVTASKVSRITGISPTHTRLLISKLKSQGYVIGEQDPNIKSRILLRATSA